MLPFLEFKDPLPFVVNSPPKHEFRINNQIQWTISTEGWDMDNSFLLPISWE